jgi:predicted Fe-Mo cluster-binding NifX family protein
MPEPVRLAVASKEGKAISEHFGHAKLFWIYEVTPQQCRLLETRDVEHYCLGNHSSKTAMVKILETIKDCRAVFVAKIGDGPSERLADVGVRAVSRYAYEVIEDSLLDYVRAAASEADS